MKRHVVQSVSAWFLTVLVMTVMTGCGVSGKLTARSPDGKFRFRCKIVEVEGEACSVFFRRSVDSEDSIRVPGVAEWLALSPSGDRLAALVCRPDDSQACDMIILDVDTMRVRHKWLLKKPSRSPGVRSASDGPPHRMAFTRDGSGIVMLCSSYIPMGYGYKGGYRRWDVVNVRNAATGRPVAPLLLGGMNGREPFLDEHSVDMLKHRSMRDLYKLLANLECEHSRYGHPLCLSPKAFSPRFTEGYLNPPSFVSVKWRESGSSGRVGRTTGYKVLWDKCTDPARMRLACWDWANQERSQANVCVWSLLDGTLQSVTRVQGAITGISYDRSARVFRVSREDQSTVLVSAWEYSLDR